MKRNIGDTERVIRILIGIALIGLGFDFKSWWGTIGILPILTAALRYCPLYQLIGKSTYKKRLLPLVYPE